MPFLNWILDLVIVLCLAAGFYYGWKRGFLKIVLKTFAGLFSAIFALTLFDKLGTVLKEKYVYSFVHTKISGDLRDGRHRGGLSDLDIRFPFHSFFSVGSMLGINDDAVFDHGVRQ